MQGILITPVAGADARLARRAAPRHPGGAGRQPVADPRPVLGVRRRRARRRPGRVPPARGRPPADRLRRRPAEHPAGRPTAGTGRVRALERAGRDGRGPARDRDAGAERGRGTAGRARPSPACPRRRRPTAVFCANDLLALGVLQEMTAAPDRACPRASRSWATTTSTSRPRPRCRCPRCASRGTSSGRAAAQLLIEEALGDGTHRHRQVVFEPDLVVRASQPAGPPVRRQPRSRRGAPRHGGSRRQRGGGLSPCGSRCS